MKSVYELSFLEQPRPGGDWYTDFTDLHRFDPQPMTLFEEAGAGGPHDDDSEPLSRQSLVCGRSLGLRRCRVVFQFRLSFAFACSPSDAAESVWGRSSGVGAAYFSDAHTRLDGTNTGVRIAGRIGGQRVDGRTQEECVSGRAGRIIALCVANFPQR